MTDWLDIGSSPPYESCAQVGADDNYPRTRRECQAYINILRRKVGPEPAGAKLGIRSNQHDYGPYLSVVCHFEKSNERAVAYAFQCERVNIDVWDAEARRELDLKEDEP